MGLFLLLPVMSIVGQDLSGATPLLVGFALGVYGLFQALLQIPFGLLSDRYGRKPLIYIGLTMLIIGSLVAAASDSIWGVIIGRALQGAGAISAAVIALAADLTRDDQRTKMMAVIGASIGLSFILSIMLGPLLMTSVGLSGIFIFIAVLGLAGLLLVRFLVPDPPAIELNRDVSVVVGELRRLLKHPQLLRLDIGILVLHFLITATFVCVPLGFVERSIAPEDHWQVYLVACMLSLLIVVPLVGFGESRLGVRRVMTISIVGLALSEFLNQYGRRPQTQGLITHRFDARRHASREVQPARPPPLAPRLTRRLTSTYGTSDGTVRINGTPELSHHLRRCGLGSDEPGTRRCDDRARSNRGRQPLRHGRKLWRIGTSACAMAR